ncbi:MAG TPA: 2-oxoacid:ferredoxin oxidoreductase subunit gamma [Peptococcaceae bacterium]|nr:2-oxoacid:ferredoxin oxidoreductase subunit gamma [Peptococcaceae bacterium]
MKHELLFSGIGGQGIMMLGEILCNVAVEEGFQVTFAPFYGQEKRGGRTMCHVVIADGLESPIISEAELMLVMDEKSLKDFQNLMAPTGTLLVNSSMIDIEPDCQCKEVKKVPFYEIATELGNSKTANMVALGYLLKYMPYIPYEKVSKEVEKAFEAKPKVVPLNVQALKTGYEYK